MILLKMFPFVCQVLGGCPLSEKYFTIYERKKGSNFFGAIFEQFFNSPKPHGSVLVNDFWPQHPPSPSLS